MRFFLGFLLSFFILSSILPNFFLKEMKPWSPPISKGLIGDFKSNNLLKDTIYELKGFINNPEDVAIDSLGRTYVGLEDGKIVRHEKGNKFEVLVNTGGRPLGLHIDKEDHLIIADAEKGLFKLDTQKNSLKLLFNKYEGIFVPFLDDVTVGKNGIIYFTQASDVYSFKEYKKDFIYHKGTGKVFSFDPQTKESKLLIKDLNFANGIAISKNDDFILINETGKYRVLKYFLKGPKIGKTEVLIDNLPGFPDGISSNGKDIFWLAIIDPRDKLLDRILPFPNLRKILLLLPNFLVPPRPKYGGVFGLNSQGKVLYNFQDPKGKQVSAITSVQQFGDKLYLGTLRNSYYGWLPLYKLKKEKINMESKK